MLKVAEQLGKKKAAKDVVGRGNREKVYFFIENPFS